MKKSHIFKIHGKVQGVFYREGAKRKADELGLCGWVKNLEDGTVLCLVQGNEKRIKEFLHWCRQGSKLARVDKIDIIEVDDRNFSDFSIIY